VRAGERIGRVRDGEPGGTGGREQARCDVEAPGDPRSPH